MLYICIGLRNTTDGADSPNYLKNLIIMRGTRKSIWHDAKEEPQESKFIVVMHTVIEHTCNNEFATTDYKRIHMDAIEAEYTWSEFVEENGAEKWCYEIDLEMA